MIMIPVLFFSKNSSSSSGFTVDLTPPEVQFVSDSEHGYKFISDKTSMYAKWQFTDGESGIKEYR